MASAFTSAVQSDLAQANLAAHNLAAQAVVKRFSGHAPSSPFVIPDMLSCLVLTWSQRRAQLLQSVALDESWHAKVCGDVQEFLRSVFQLDVPLTVVDLPRKEVASYAELRAMATQTHGVNRSLLVICGAPEDSDAKHSDAKHSDAKHSDAKHRDAKHRDAKHSGAEHRAEEEQWARQLGAWAYLPGATDPSGLRLVFAEARKALAKQSTTYVEASGYQ